MNWRTPSIIAALAVLLALLAGVAQAQVRNAPAGNSVPDEDAVAEAAGGAHLDPHAGPAHRQLTRAEHRRFAQQVQLDEFRRLAVFDRGRVKIIDTLAREHLDRVYGKSRWKDTWWEGPPGQQVQNSEVYDPVFTYLDLVFSPSYYYDKPMIYVEVLPLRRELVAALHPEDIEEQERWLRLGRLAPEMFADPRLQAARAAMDPDLTMQKALEQVSHAIEWFRHAHVGLNVVSPAPGSDRWAHLGELADVRTAAAAPALPQAALVADPQAARLVMEQLGQLRDAWARADAPAVNAALASLSATIPTLNAGTYPPAWKRQAEYIYNHTQKFTIGYLGYFLGALALLVAFGVQRRWLVRVGVALLLSGFAVHTAGMLVRGILSGRWPIHNQYESYIAISWLAVLAGLVMMFAKRQWLYGAAAAALGFVTLIFANTVDIPSREVTQVAGILATSNILYVHVNLVLFSYGLIALGFFIALLYLVVHYAQMRSVLRFAAAGMGSLPLDAPEPALAAAPARSAGGAGERAATRRRAAADDGGDHGDMADGDDDAGPAVGPQALLRDLDHAQMVVLQLAFWILGVGIFLGAYWADHAWGRFWAWDPKETWALITWIIYLMVIHLRLAVKRRGLVTAWMSVVGFAVMLWTYWGVNLFLAGLHSYA